MNPMTALPRIPFSLRSSRLFCLYRREEEEGGQRLFLAMRENTLRDHLERVQSRKPPRDEPTRLRPLLTDVAITKG